MARGNDGREYYEFEGAREPAAEPSVEAPKKRSRLRASGSVLLLGFVALGLAGWGWDAAHHDHEGAHGTPASLEAIQLEMTTGRWVADDGSSVAVAGADCSGEGEPVAGRFTHFDCSLAFDDGTGDEVVVHLRENDELFFKSSVESP